MSASRWKIVLGCGLVLAAGCATAPESPVSFAVPSAPSDVPPEKGDYVGAYAYAENRMAAADYVRAAIYFAKAAEWVPFPGTDGRVFEYENYINAAWAAFLSGNVANARRWLGHANKLAAIAAPSLRALYLESLLAGASHAALPPNLKGTLPW